MRSCLILQEKCQLVPCRLSKTRSSPSSSFSFSSSFSSFIFFFIFKTGSQVVQTDLEFTMSPRKIQLLTEMTILYHTTHHLCSASKWSQGLELASRAAWDVAPTGVQSQLLLTSLNEDSSSWGSLLSHTINVITSLTKVTCLSSGITKRTRSPLPLNKMTDSFPSSCLQICSALL